MRKKAISLTLEESNLLWLRGRTSAAGFRSISETLDRLVSEARTSGRLDAASIQSVVGTIDIGLSDPLLESADTMIRDQFGASLRRPVVDKERPGPAPNRTRARSKSRGRG